MIQYEKNLIKHNQCILEAMVLLGNVPETLTLFVLNEQDKLIGTLTDGDIRRGFIGGNSLKDTVVKFLNPKFKALCGKVDPFEVQAFKALGIQLLPALDKLGRIGKIYDLNRSFSILPIDVVLMAGGKGERLRPLTNDIPKPMLPLANKPIIEYNIDRLIKFGIENIYISVNYLGHQIMDYFGDGSAKGVNIRYLQENEFLGTIGSVSMVQKFDNPYVLVMNSDLFTDVDLEDLWMNMHDENADLSIASIPYTINIPFAVLKRDNGRVVGLEEKPSNTHYTNAGIYLMKAKEIDRIPSNSFYNATDLVEDIIKDNGKVIDNPITGYWIDIGRHEDYNKAKEIVRHL